MACVTISIRRLSTRSTTRPPKLVKRRMGANRKAVTKPSARALPVRCNTSQSWATDCIQFPVTETSWTDMKIR